jgi:DNA-binding NarL/FixJ family response regulator
METAYNTKILLVDDHSLILQGIRRIIEQIEGIALVHAVSSGAEAASLIASNPYDIYLLDVEMPDISGFDLIKQIRERDEDARIIINTMHEKSWIINKLIKLEVNAIILKSSDARVVVEAIQSVLNNKSYCCPRFEHVHRKLRNGIGAELHEDDIPTKRELDVLKAIAGGNSTAQIASIMNVTENTIETYRKRLFLKFDAKNAVDLVVKAVAKGWVKIES